MLRVLGSRRRLCSGPSRREALLVGTLGFGGWTLADQFTSQGAPSGSNGAGGFGKSKNVILLYLFGGPSHVDLFDMKPDAAAEVRGAFKPIRTRLSGFDINEHLPRSAQVMDRVTVIRSLAHPWNFHGMQWATTGVTEGNVPIEETQKHVMHQPFVGSVMARHWEEQQGRKPCGSVPDNVILPWLLSTRRPAAHYARPHASHLGNVYDPLWTEFRGKATRGMERWSHGPREMIQDPYLGITPESRFEIAAETELPAEMTLDRLAKRRSLLEQFDQARRDLDRDPSLRNLDRQRALAYSLLQSQKVRDAFDLGQENDRIRELYGMTLFGQGALQARRLVESGCRFVTVIWDEVGQLNAGWDTHVDQENRLKNDLCPGFDRAFSGLIRDLQDRGLFDETLVLVMSEMGRTPKLQGDGRGHWGYAYTNLIAGAGVKRGQVIGKTDAIGSQVTDRPLTAKDLLATVYHLLGVDPHSTFPDRLNRPVPLIPYGDVIREVLA